MYRHYYRCVVCLSVGATEEYHAPKNLICAICEGGIEHMGAVNQDKLVSTEDRTPCDARCTHASGPTCVCSCGGKNHGSHIVIKVTVIKGNVPALSFDNESAIAIATEFRQWWGMVEQLFNAKFNDILEKSKTSALTKGERMTLYRSREIRKDFLLIKNARQHTSRMQKLQAIMERIGDA